MMIMKGNCYYVNVLQVYSSDYSDIRIYWYVYDSIYKSVPNGTITKLTYVVSDYIYTYEYQHLHVFPEMQI